MGPVLYAAANEDLLPLAAVTVLQAIILGAVQGLTEFLPVSSSGHLVIVPELLNMESPTLAFDVLLHLATVAAVAGYFVRELFSIVLAFVAPQRFSRAEAQAWRRLGLWVVLGSLPAAVAGLAFKDFVESLFDSTLAVGVFLLLTAALLFTSDLVARRRSLALRGVGQMGVADALIIGLFQALALAPGISRSGSTIAGGVYLGLGREQAARFSFLLAIPAILGAGLLSLGDLASGFEGQAEAYIAGSLAAVITGVLAVHFMLRFLRVRGLRPFAIYTLLVGLLVIALSLA